MSIKKRNLRGDLKLGEYAEKGNFAKFYVDEHDICDGAVKLLRTKQSGDVWQMRCWITEEKKYIKKSLRTKDLETAKEKGRTLYYTMMGADKCWTKTVHYYCKRTCREVLTNATR